MSGSCDWKCIIFIFVLQSVSHGFPLDSVSEQYPFKFYTREEWGAAPSTDMKNITVPVPFVVIHHTAIPAACNTSKTCSTAMKSMQNYHKSLNWGDIGYNFCVGSDGAVYEGRGWDVIGIHAMSANRYSIGICLIGDWRYELPPINQLETTRKLISVGVKKGVLSSEYKLIGHSQITATECPGQVLYNHISTWDHYSPDPVDFTAFKKS